jgi:hypothetical protein
LRAQIRAGEIVRAMAQKTTCLVELLVADETDEVVIDWAQAAQDAWHGESWKVAAMDYRIECRKQRGVRR